MPLVFIVHIPIWKGRREGHNPPFFRGPHVPDPLAGTPEGLFNRERFPVPFPDAKEMIMKSQILVPALEYTVRKRPGLPERKLALARNWQRCFDQELLVPEPKGITLALPVEGLLLGT